MDHLKSNVCKARLGLLQRSAIARYSGKDVTRDYRALYYKSIHWSSAELILDANTGIKTD